MQRALSNMLSLWASRAQLHWGTLWDNVEQAIELSNPYSTPKGQGYCSVYFYLMSSACSGIVCAREIQSEHQQHFLQSLFSAVQVLFHFNPFQSDHVRANNLVHLSHIFVIKHHIPLILILPNRHIINFDFELFLILKDSLQDLIFIMCNKYSKSNQTFYISHFPLWRNYMVLFEKVIQELILNWSTDD